VHREAFIGTFFGVPAAGGFVSSADIVDVSEETASAESMDDLLREILASPTSDALQTESESSSLLSTPSLMDDNNVVGMGLGLDFDMPLQSDLEVMAWGNEEEKELERILGTMVDVSAACLNTPIEFPSALELGQDTEGCWDIMAHTNPIGVF